MDANLFCGNGAMIITGIILSGIILSGIYFTGGFSYREPINECGTFYFAHDGTRCIGHDGFPCGTSLFWCDNNATYECEQNVKIVNIPCEYAEAKP
jgi:hypothetical protein